jgi:hypothetical protein
MIRHDSSGEWELRQLFAHTSGRVRPQRRESDCCEAWKAHHAGLVGKQGMSGRKQRGAVSTAADRRDDDTAAKNSDC